jgi:hypothetical protein
MGVVFFDRLLQEAHRLSLLAPAMQRGQSQPTPPKLSSHKPTAQESGWLAAILINRSRRLLCCILRIW